MTQIGRRLFDQQTDIPKTGWDEFTIHDALQEGKALYVYQNGEVWTLTGDYIGKVQK